MFSNASAMSNITDIAYDNFNVVSIQSTARPGCIIELERVVDSDCNWSKADLFHVFQENLIFAGKDQSSKFFEGSGHSNQQLFAESYYLVLLEKRERASSGPVPDVVEVVQVWKIAVTSSPLFAGSENQPPLGSEAMSRSESMSPVSQGPGLTAQKSRMCITSVRVCRQELDLPKGVTVVKADPAAADLSSSAMFTLSQVPYLFSTACSDGNISLVWVWFARDRLEGYLK